MGQNQCQVLVVGAGITGLTIARELVNRGVEDILLLEKEGSLGAHASGRNSGILHAGIYYTIDTLKARFCVDGNRLMKEFCRERGLRLRETGKVILARNPSEVETLYELKRRADLCGARAFLVDRKELGGIEPHAAVCDKALFSPDTAVISPEEVLRALGEELARSAKATIAYETAFEGLLGGKQVRTSRGIVRFDKFVNAAGAYGDWIAHQFGLAGEYRLLPFKGTYQKLSRNRAFLVRGNVYPVPDLRNPFLGVHLTRGVDDEVYVGPTAIPAFSREDYHAFAGWDGGTFSILFRDAVLLLKNQSFRRVALAEPRKYLKWFVLEEARKMVPELRLHDLVDAHKVGIRPQLVHWPTKTLVMDFFMLRDGDALHILNPISPAFTSSMAFAKYAVDTLLA
jgi:L-2-hydroxyglutarate oxidase